MSRTNLDPENEPVAAPAAPSTLQAQARSRIRWLMAWAGVLLLLLFFLSTLTYLNFNRLRDANDWNVHSYQVLNQSGELRNALDGVERRLRGFALTEDPNYYVPRFTDDARRARAAIRELRFLTRDRDDQLKRLNAVEREFKSWYTRFVERDNRVYYEHSLVQAHKIAIETTPRRLGLEKIIKQLDIFDATERTLLRERETAQRSALYSTARALLLGSFFAIVSTGVLALLLARSAQGLELSNRRLREENSERLRIEERFRHLAEDSLDMICRHDAEGYFSYVSPAVHPLLGYWPEELIGRHPFEIMHPDELNLREKSGQTPFSEFLRGGREPILYRFKKKNEEYAWLEIVGHAILDPDTDEVREWQTTSRDVTARVRDEEKRRRMLEGLRAVLQVADELIEIQPEDEAALLRRAVTAARDYMGCGACALWTVVGKDELVGAFEARAGGPARSLADKHVDYTTAHVYLQDFATGWHGARWRRVESDPLGVLQGPVAITPLWSEGGVVATLHNQIETEEGGHEDTNGRQELVVVFCSLLGTLLSRSRAETRYRTSEARYRRVVQTLKEAIFQTDEAGTFTFLNPAWSEIAGYAVSETLGRSHVEFVETRDRARWQNGFDFLASKRTEQIRLVLRYRTRDHEIRWLELFGQRVNDRQGEFAGMTGTLNDVTDRLMTENALNETLETQRAILESAAYAIIATNAQGLVRVFNPAAENMLQRSAQEVLDKPLPLEIFDRAELETRARELAIEYEVPVAANLEVLDLPARRRGDCEREWTLRRASGEMFHARLSYSPLHNTEGQVTGYVSIIYDLTETQRAERLKNEFVSVVSHELRTPLTSIRGSLGLLNGGVAGDLPPKAGQMLNIAIKNADRLSLLINDILDIEKIENGRLGFEMALVSLEALLKNALDANGAYGQPLGVSIQLEPVDAELHHSHVLGDESRLQQVLANFLSNAFKWTPRGGTIHLRARLQSEHVVRVEVEDEGPGVPDEFVTQLFERFAQADSSATRRQGGTGLGLAIARAIIQRHGGAIGYLPPDQTAGRCGGTFYFDLTLAPVIVSL